MVVIDSFSHRSSRFPLPDAHRGCNFAFSISALGSTLVALNFQNETLATPTLLLNPAGVLVVLTPGSLSLPLAFSILDTALTPLIGDKH